MIFGVKSIFILLIGISNMMHHVHISITNMDYISTENKIKLSFKVFESDFQLLFAHLYEVKIDFDDPENIKINQNKIDDYFSSHFRIENDQSYSLVFRTIKKEDDSIWFYYESLVDKGITNFEISNTLFLDLYFDQKNMLIVNHNQNEKGYLFNLNQIKYIIAINDI